MALIDDLIAAQRGNFSFDQTGRVGTPQELSFPAFDFDSPAQKGFMFASKIRPRVERPLTGPAINPFTGLPFDDEFFSPMEDVIGGSGDTDLDPGTVTPGDRDARGDTFGEKAADIGRNVFGQAALGVLGAPPGLGFLAAFSRAVLDPERERFFSDPFGFFDPSLNIFDAVDFDDAIDSLEDGLVGAIGTIGEDEPDEGFSPGAGGRGVIGNEEQGTENFGEGPGGESGEGSDDRVICTELCRQGRIDRKLLVADLKYSRKHVSKTTLVGYHFWARPYVRLMKRSRLATRLIAPIGILRARECAWQLCQADRPCWSGKLIRLVGEPLCFAIGALVVPGKKMSRQLSSLRQRVLRRKGHVPGTRQVQDNI